MTKTLFRSRTCWTLAAAMTAALLLPSCTPAPEDISLNRIAVKPVQAAHMVNFAPGSAALAPAEASSLRTFLGGGRVIGVTLVAGDSPIASARRARVSQTLDTLGYPHSVAPADPSFAADAVLVTVNREVAVPPACPNWTVIGPYDPSNAPSTNLGCATRTDLYLMVADPRDLVSGHPLAPADAAPSMHAVETYRTGKPSASLGSADGASSGSSAGASTSSSSNGQ
ncbi:MAG: hypothetical protein KGL11_01650 [Alphaproteobacteria bacterium]|nr:hypothetical protein [Alphaproteobacteria bacterium]